MRSMTFSIVIPTYARTDLLAHCLASVSRYAPADAEVIVVDDASPANEVRRAADSFPQTRVIRLARRSGFCAAANAGIAASHGDVVELLNDDTEVCAGWAEGALSWFSDPAVGAVAPLVLTGPEGMLVDSAGDRYYVGGVAGKRGHGLPPGRDLDQAAPVFGASGSSAFYRRKALEKVGGFPELFGAYFEDVDLAFRLQRAGYRAVFEPAARVLHRISASYGRRPTRRLLEQQACNEERVFWRNIPSADLPRALPRHVAVLAGKAWRRWREGNLVPFLTGRLRLLAEVAAIRRHRRELRLLGPDRPVEAWHIETAFWS
jgi:GT2 family glycosyltransferase